MTNNYNGMYTYIQTMRGKSLVVTLVGQEGKSPGTLPPVNVMLENAKLIL